MRTLDELAAGFKAATFNKLRASICREIWAQAPEAERKKRKSSVRGAYVSDVLAMGGVDSPPSMRWVNDAVTLYNAGTAADAFWERTEGPQPMPVTTALRLYRESYARASEEKTSVESAASKVLAEYDALPHVTRLPDGHFTRRPSVSRLRVAVPEPQPKKPAKHPTTAAKEDWREVRSAVAALVERRLQDTEPALRDQLWRRFERDLNVLLDEWSNTLRTLRKSEAQTRSVTLATLHRHVQQACSMLMMDPPKRGQPVDLRKADRQKKMLARQYHPDASGTDATRDAYQAVLAAFESCEVYNAQIGVKAAPKLEVVK